MWQLREGEPVTPEKLAWLKSMKDRLEVVFQKTGTTATGPQGQVLEGLRLLVRLHGDCPVLQEQLSNFGFVEVEDLRATN
jgi:hypothetical protein